MNKPELEKFQTVPLTLRWSVFALSVLVIAGCVTTSHDKGDSTARSLERAAAEVQDPAPRPECPPCIPARAARCCGLDPR